MRPLVKNHNDTRNFVSEGLAFGIYLLIGVSGSTLAGATESVAPDPALLNVPTTKVLAIGSFTEGTTPKVWLPMVPEEARRTAVLYFDGKIDQWYVKQDKTGVVFVMNAKTSEEAHAMLDGLPMGVAGVMKFQMIPLGPIAPLRMIISKP